MIYFYRFLFFLVALGHSFFLGVRFFSNPRFLWKELSSLWSFSPSFEVFSSKKVLWVHAPSVGEMRAALTLISPLLESVGEDLVLFVSAETEAGVRLAEKWLPSDPRIQRPFRLPYDLFIDKWIQKLNPDLLILVEGGLWPSLLSAATKVVLFNGKLSKRSLFCFSSLSWLRKLLLSKISFVYLRDEAQKEHFIQLGFSNERLLFLGNLKCDQSLLPIKEKKLERILIASTHKGEEKRLLEAIYSISKRPLALAPRHMNRIKEIRRLLEKLNIPYQRSSLKEREDPEKLLLIDEIGELHHYYASSSITLLGGSFVEGVGGHFPLEPLFYGSVPCFGPFMSKQQPWVDSLLEAKAAFSLPFCDLPSFFHSLEERDLSPYRQRGEELLKQLRGAAKRGVAHLLKREDFLLS